LKTLKVLNLGSNKLGDGLCKKIAECSLNNLEELNLPMVGLKSVSGI